MLYPEPFVRVLSGLFSRGRPRHCRRSSRLVMLHGRCVSTFLHPLAPRALPRFHATMDALTPARLALRTLLKGSEHQPCSGQVSLFYMTHLSMHSVTNHPACPVIAFTLSTQRDGLPESTLMGSPGVSGLDFTTNELARRNTRPKRVRHYPTDCMFASGCSPPRLTATQLPSATGSGHLPEGTFTPKARLLGGALIPAKAGIQSKQRSCSKDLSTQDYCALPTLSSRPFPTF